MTEPLLKLLRAAYQSSRYVNKFVISGFGNLRGRPAVQIFLFQIFFYKAILKRECAEEGLQWRKPTKEAIVKKSAIDGILLHRLFYL